MGRLVASRFTTRSKIYRVTKRNRRVTPKPTSSRTTAPSRDGRYSRILATALPIASVRAAVHSCNSIVIDEPVWLLAVYYRTLYLAHAQTESRAARSSILRFPGSCSMPSGFSLPEPVLRLHAGLTVASAVSPANSCICLLDSLSSS